MVVRRFIATWLFTAMDEAARNSRVPVPVPVPVPVIDRVPVDGEANALLGVFPSPKKDHSPTRVPHIVHCNAASVGLMWPA